MGQVVGAVGAVLLLPRGSAHAKVCFGRQNLAGIFFEINFLTRFDFF